MDKSIYLEKALDWVKSKNVSSIRSISNEHEDPKSFISKTTDELLQPDISYESPIGGKHYTDIALKSDHPRKLVTRWKLFSTMASVKRGKLHLLAPKGHKNFTQRLVNKYDIKAHVHSL